MVTEVTQYTKDILARVGYEEGETAADILARTQPVEPLAPIEVVAPVSQPKIEDSLRRLYPEMYEGFEYGDEQNTSLVLKTIKSFAFENPDAFTQDIKSIGRNQDTETLLRALQVPEPVMNEMFAPTLEEQALFKSVLPLVVTDRNATKMTDYFLNDRDALRRSLITAGRNEKTESLVKYLYPEVTDKELKDYFSLRVPGMALLGQLPSKTWLDKWNEVIKDPVQVVPFASSAKEIITLADLMQSALDYEQGKELTKEQWLALKAYVDKATMDTTWSYEVTDVIAQCIPFAGELILTGGIFSTGKTATVKAGQAALKRVATRTGLRILEGKLAMYGVEVAGVLVGGTLQTIPAGITRIPAATLEKQLQATLTGDEESVWESAAKSLGEAWVETVSERSGGLFTPLANRVKGQLVRVGLFKVFQRVNPGKSSADLQRIMERMGYNGVLEEMLEERVGDVMHGVLYELGLSDQEFKLPSARQLSVELVSFSVPGVAAKALQATPWIYEKLKPEVKEALSAAVEQARIAPERGAIELPGKPEKVTPAPEVTQLKALGWSDARIAELDQEERASIIRNKITPEAAKEVPVTEAGMPEAGYQPAMLPEVTEREVRPRGKGEIVQISMEDQLKLQQARQQVEETKVKAEEAPQDVKEAYEAQAQIEGIKETHLSDPVANYRITETVTRKVKQPDGSYNLTQSTRQVGLDRFINIREQAFPEYFTVKEAQMLRPNDDWSYYNQKGTPQYNHIPRNNVLDTIAQEMGYDYTGGIDDMVARVMQIRREKATLREAQETIKRQMTEKPVALEKETKDVSDLIKVRGEPLYTIEQIDTLSGIVGEYLVNPNTVNAYQVVRKYQALERARRFENVANRRQELIVTEGLSWEEAHNKAMDEFAKGKLPTLTIEGLQGITDELRDVFFAKVHYTFDQLGSRYEGERWATITALTNALSGKPIPMDKGKGSLLFPKGGSAWDRLNYVFGKQPRLMGGLTKTAKEKKSLQDVVQGIFREVPEGGLPPISVDMTPEELLPPTKPLDQIRLGEKEGLLTFREAEDLTNKLSDLTIEDQRTFVEKIIEMRRKKLLPVPPVTWFDSPIESEIRKHPSIPRTFSDVLVDALKQLAWAPIDILNGLKSILASLDQSFALRQLLWIAPEIGTKYKQVMVTSWKAGWSQNAADAARERVTQRVWYQMYKEGVEGGRGDPLRLKGIEEFGYVGESKRLISRLFAAIPTTKWSERNYVAGINEGVAVVLDKTYQMLLRKSEKIANGEITFKKLEAFDFGKEFFDVQDFLANTTGRATIGRMTPDATFLQAVNALLFSMRFKLGRFLMPIHLLGLNKVGKDAHFSPAIMKRAWKDFGIVFGGISSVIALGVLMGWWDTELDRDSPDFLKIRIGKTRIDPWGGMQQIAVFAFQLFDKRAVSTITGAEYPVELSRAIWNMFEKSGSPLTSLAIDLYTGKTFTGEKVDLTDAKQWADRVAPFMAQNIYDFFIEGSDNVGLLPAVAALGWFGVGIQTYTGKWGDDWDRRGLSKYQDNLLYGITEPPYTNKDFWSKYSSQFTGVDPASLTEQKGYEPYIRNMVEAKIILDKVNDIPNQSLVSLNADPTKDKGLTYIALHKLWKDRVALVDAGDEAIWTFEGETYKGEDAITKFDSVYPQAELGNFSQTQLSLLSQYWMITGKKEQQAFLDKYKEDIGVNLRQKYYKANPKENALLAFWGQADIYSKDAYNEVKRLMGEYDTPELGMSPMTLPPKESIDLHFRREELVSEDKEGGAEGELLLLKDFLDAQKAGRQSYAEWKNLKVSDKALEYWQMRFDNQQNYDDLKVAQEAKDEDLVAEIRARKVGNETFHDIERRVDAMNKGTRDNPIGETLVNGYVDHMKIVDQTSGNSAEAKLNRYDNSALNGFLMNEDYWGKSKAEPLDEDKNYLDNYLVPGWRIDVKYRKEDAEYQAILDRNDSDENSNEAKAYMAEHEDYRKDDRRRKGLVIRGVAGERFPLDQVEAYVNYYELPEKGYQQERYRLENPDFDAVMTDTTIMGDKVLSTLDPTKIPDRRYDEIYLEYQDLFDEWDSYGQGTSPNYIADEKQRAEKRDSLLARNPDFQQARWEQDAYLLFIGKEEYVPEYVGYQVIVDKGKPTGAKYWFDDDWYIIDHPEFWKALKEEKRKTEPNWGDEKEKEIKRAPPKDLFNAILEYDAAIGVDVSTAELKRQLRRNNPKLDAWLVLVGAVAKPIEQIDEEAGLTSGKKANLELTKKRLEIDRLKEEIQRKLKALK